MCWQKSPMMKGRIESAFARLDKLSSGKAGEDVSDAQELMRRTGLFM